MRFKFANIEEFFMLGYEPELLTYSGAMGVTRVFLAKKGEKIIPIRQSASDRIKLCWEIK